MFPGDTTAFHPRVGNVRVRAEDVRHGFIAFTYSENFQGFLDDRSVAVLRRDGSRNNIRNDAIRFLARYVRDRLRRPEAMQPLELQFLVCASSMPPAPRVGLRCLTRSSRSCATTSRRTSNANLRVLTYLVP